jgi:hypothetical protein
MANGVSRQAAALVLTGPEAQSDLVQCDCAQFLSRPADPRGHGDLDQGQRDQAILAAILGSEEFFNRQ